jgi:hypothetical protein
MVSPRACHLPRSRARHVNTWRCSTSEPKRHAMTSRTLSYATGLRVYNDLQDCLSVRFTAFVVKPSRGHLTCLFRAAHPTTKLLLVWLLTIWKWHQSPSDYLASLREIQVGRYRPIALQSRTGKGVVPVSNLLTAAAAQLLWLAVMHSITW